MQTTATTKDKVLFVSYDGKPFNGPRAHWFAKIFNQLGLETEVFSLKDDLGASYHGPESYKTGNIERAKLFIKCTLRLLKEPSSTKLIVIKAGFHSLSAAILSTIKGNKIILDYDDYEYDEQFSIRNLLFKIILKKSCAVVAASKFLQEFILAKTKKPVYHIPGGINAQEVIPLKNKTKEKLYTFTWMGNVSDEEVLNNIFFLMDCFKEVHSTNPKTRLHLRASGELVKKIEERLTKGEDKNIKIISWIENVSEYLATVHCGLFPLINKTKYNAAKCPGKVFTYMSAGLPVICTDFGESQLIIKNNQNGFLTDGKEGFVKIMLQLSKNSELNNNIGKEARKTIEQEFDINKLAEKYKMIIDELN